MAAALATSLVGVPRGDVSTTLWAVVEPILARALKRSDGRYSTDDVLQAIDEGKQQLWIVTEGKTVRAAVTTEIRNYPAGVKACNVRMCAGEGYREWVGHIDSLAEWAKEQGCSLIEVMGREGWWPSLRSLGYKKTQVVYQAEI